MKKRSRIIKQISALSLIFLLSINSFAVEVNDNDGSVFITKAEFDALKSSFQAQIDSYNQSIDSKIDNAIASYLAGITINKDVDVNSILYSVLKENRDIGFYNIKSLATNWAYEPQISFTGTHFMQCGYRAVYYRARETYTGYLVRHSLNTAIGNANNLVELYDIKDGKKVHNKVIKGFRLSYNLSSTQLDYGQHLYYGGYFKSIKYSNRNMPIFDPGVEKTELPYNCLVDEIGYANSSNNGYTFSGVYVAGIPNDFTGATNPAATYGSAAVYIRENIDRSLTDIYTGYRYDTSFSDLTTNVPLFDASTTKYNIINATSDFNDKSSYKVRVAQLKHTFGASFGGGENLWATGIGYLRTTNPTAITATSDVDLYTLNTYRDIEANTICNKYIYEHFDLFLPNNEVYLPLFTYAAENSGTATFEFKPNTTAGKISVYENPIGTTSINLINLSGENIATGASVGNTVPSLTLEQSTNYKIKFDFGKKRNYIIKWVPSADTAGANTFNTSDLINLKIND